MRKSQYDNYEMMQEKITLSQQIASDHPEFEEYSGSDVDLAQRIARINVYIRYGLLDKEDPSVTFLRDMCIERAKAIFASSDKTDIVTKLGFKRKKRVPIYGRLQHSDQKDL